MLLMYLYGIQWYGIQWSDHVKSLLIKQLISYHKGIKEGALLSKIADSHAACKVPKGTPVTELTGSTQQRMGFDIGPLESYG